MPPRIRLQSCPQLPSPCNSSAPAIAPLERAWHASRPCAARPFSTTTSLFKRTANWRRLRMEKWMAREGKKLKHYNPSSSQNFLDPFGIFPFPTNTTFQSKPVLSDSARELIYKRVMVEGETITSVSAEFGVDQRRVAAVVRLKQVEKDWIARGEKLATPYAKAVLNMLSAWDLKPGFGHADFEPINEIHVHGYTMQQLFVPTSESRHFTREDAAKAFNTRLLSPDRRMPHPELVQMERELLQGADPLRSWEAFKERTQHAERAVQARQQAAEAAEERITTRVETPRFEFRFKDMNVDTVGRSGRSSHGVGWRYGNPSEDRKKDQIKIPTKVE